MCFHVDQYLINAQNKVVAFQDSTPERHDCITFRESWHVLHFPLNWSINSGEQWNLYDKKARKRHVDKHCAIEYSVLWRPRAPSYIYIILMYIGYLCTECEWIAIFNASHNFGHKWRHVHVVNCICIPPRLRMTLRASKVEVIKIISCSPEWVISVWIFMGNRLCLWCMSVIESFANLVLKLHVTNIFLTPYNPQTNVLLQRNWGNIDISDWDNTVSQLLLFVNPYFSYWIPKGTVILF